MARVEVVDAGNEILNGDVRDDDIHAVARAVADLGDTVSRATIVRDDVEAIAGAVREALARGSRLVVTIGGLGPTPDDRTVEGVARAVGRELVLDAAARAFVAERYAALAREGRVRDAAMSAPREKMARLPRGATWLRNEVGTAPAPVLEVDGATIVSLPGPPRELEGILHGPLRPVLRHALGASAVARASYRLALDDETRFAPIHERVQPAHPRVYLKSRFQGFAHEGGLLVTLAARGADERDAEAKLADASRGLEDALRAAGIGFRRDEAS